MTKPELISKWQATRAKLKAGRVSVEEQRKIATIDELLSDFQGGEVNEQKWNKTVADFKKHGVSKLEKELTEIVNEFMADAKSVSAVEPEPQPAPQAAEAAKEPAPVVVKEVATAIGEASHITMVPPLPFSEQFCATFGYNIPGAKPYLGTNAWKLKPAVVTYTPDMLAKKAEGAALNYLWELRPNLPAEETRLLSDPDGDGMPQVLEWITGKNPFSEWEDAANFWMVAVSPFLGDNDPKQEFRSGLQFTRRVDAAEAGVKTIIECGDGADVWREAAEGTDIDVLGVYKITPGVETIVIANRHTLQGNRPLFFLRPKFIYSPR